MKKTLFFASISVVLISGTIACGSLNSQSSKHSEESSTQATYPNPQPNPSNCPQSLTEFNLQGLETPGVRRPCDGNPYETTKDGSIRCLTYAEIMKKAKEDFARLQACRSRGTPTPTTRQVSTGTQESLAPTLPPATPRPPVATNPQPSTPPSPTLSAPPLTRPTTPTPPQPQAPSRRAIPASYDRYAPYNGNDYESGDVPGYLLCGPQLGLIVLKGQTPFPECLDFMDPFNRPICRCKSYY